MESVILVKSVEKKHKGKGNWLEVTDEKGWKHNIFLKDKFDLIEESVGKHLKLTIEKGDDDQYWNTTEVELVDEAEVKAETTPTPSRARNDDETRRSIERQVSAKLGCEFFGTKGVGAALLTAEKIYQWISGSSDAKPAKATKKEESFPDIVKEEWAKMGGKIEEERDFKDAGVFMAECYTKFGYDNAKVEEIVKMPLAQITNFKVAWSLVVNHKEESNG